MNCGAVSSPGSFVLVFPFTKFAVIDFFPLLFAKLLQFSQAVARIQHNADDKKQQHQ